MIELDEEGKGQGKEGLVVSRVGVERVFVVDDTHQRCLLDIL